MARNLFSKGTKSGRSSNGPSSKQKQPQTESSIRVSNKRPKQPTPNVTYPCHLCPKVYPSIHALRGHQNAHKKDKLVIPGIQLVVDFTEYEVENHVEANPAPHRGCDAPNCHRRYRALRMRAINHHSQPLSRSRRAHARPRPCPCPPPQIPIHPNRNQGNQRYVAPRRTVSNIPPTPPPSPTYTVTLVPTQVTINEWVPPTTRRQPPPPPPPVVEPKVEVEEVLVVEPKVEVEEVLVVEPKVEVVEVPVVEPKVEVEEVPAQPSFPPNFGNLQIDGAADANVDVDDNPNGLDLELRL